MSIHFYPLAPLPVRHAAHRLAKHTGIIVGDASQRGPHIIIERNDTADGAIGWQGYTIHGGKGSDITIRGNHEEGVANGVYTFLRTLMIERRTDPFSREWKVAETPHFAIRSFIISPYRFGGSFGYAALSPDRWSVEEWKEHVDFMRLCNMTTLCMGSARMYHPAYPHSHREKWRYEVWKEVMDYCHQVGMKFNWFVAPNIVCEQAFWDNPTLRTVSAKANWYGNSLIWHKAKDLILENQRHTLEFFSGLDGLELIYSDGGAFSFDDATGADPAGFFADATKSYMQLMRDVNNDADFVFWNWGLDVWAKVLLPLDELGKYPKYKTMQDDVLPLLPKNVQWLDTSMLTWIQCYAHMIRARGNPALREHILLGREHGFGPSIDFFWYMNPEFSVNIFPHPYLQRGIQEAQYAKNELKSDGVMGYRLAPPCRFVDDYAFFRLASNPDLTQDQIVKEAAGLLCAKPENQARAADAINTLETFWTTHTVADLEKAESKLRGLLASEPSKNLEYVSHGLSFFLEIVKMAQPGLDPIEKERLCYQLYQKAKQMYIMQGLVADVICVADATPLFNFHVERMVQEYSKPMVRDTFLPETVDRSIYPAATSKPVKLDFSKTKQTYRLDPGELVRLARLANIRVT